MLSACISRSPLGSLRQISRSGTLASATVDFERNAYLLHQHTRYGLNFAITA